VNGDVLVVTVVPPQIRDAAIAYGLRDEIISLLDALPTRDLVLDVANTQFIGSIGFLAFLGVRRRLEGGRIILCNLSAPVRDMFAVCKLIATDPAKDAPFETAETVEAALARLAG
jgi:anti-anti-sigma factor